MYRFQRHFYDASRRFYLLGRDTLLDRLDPPPGGSILEIGCGTGRNLVGAARRYPDARLFGVDISQEMLMTALGATRRAGCGNRITLACVDAVHFDPRKSLGEARFDRVYFSYALSMIPGWQAALLNASRMLAPDGELHIADFGQCERLPRACQSILKKWLGWFSVAPRSLLRGDIAKIAAETGHDVGFESIYGGYAWLVSMAPAWRQSRP